MIGVSVNSRDLAAAGEFFELFKTPWEPAAPGKKYRVLISTGESLGIEADLTLVYSSRAVDIDRELGIVADGIPAGDVTWDRSTFPIYGRVATLRGARGGRLTAEGKPVDCRGRVAGELVYRIGYDLFAEVGYLLTSGQPVAHALTPTLEFHIELLRRALIDTGVPFVEIPPRPHGYEFTCCLTHDIDFYGIRRHLFDRTLVGFVARASIGTFADLCRGRRSFGEAVRNWKALLSLPLVFAGLMPDSWRPLEQYARADDDRKSTFFLVPFRGRPGIGPDGTIDPVRAVPYQVSDVREDALAATRQGAELAVHGIDAWRDAEAGRAELKELTSVTDRAGAGVRMHWLYFSADAPQHLEAAGFEYDSTWGYNDGIGYRAGTAQVFRLSGCTNLLELPLSIMDSALLFPDRMALAPDAALDHCRVVLNNARRFGGTLVVNWHDRSLAPERLWDGIYRNLLDAIGSHDDVWFATGQDAVDWFRWRRSIRFGEGGTITACDRRPVKGRADVPAAVIRIHRPSATGQARFEELPISGGESLAVAL
jgi:hypothetical protein